MIGRKPDAGKITLTAFVRGIVTAVNAAQEAISASREHYFKQHMEANGETFTPKTLKVQLDKDKVLEVPTYTLSKVNDLGISSCIVTGHAKIIDFTGVKDATDACVKDSCAEFYVRPTFANDKRTFTIRLDFTSKEHNETEELLIEGLNGTVEAQKVESKKDKK